MTLNGQSLTITQLVKVARQKETVILAEEAKEKIKQCRAYLEEKIVSGEVIYGVNTGFGEFSHTKIAPEKIKELQLNLIRSHASGVGDLLPEEVVRAMMLLRINALAHGHSGISLEVVETLCQMLNKNVLPLIPAQGSVGASGDLTPLAHLALGLIGEGEIVYNGQRQAATDALAAAGIKPVILKEKEGLALINGTQLMAALGALAVYDARRLVKYADIAAAFSADVLLSSINHTDELIHQSRPFKGQRESAANMRQLLMGSELWESHKNCGKVQDAYSVRCAPQVHGAVRDALDYAQKVIEIEINSATDNPLIFPDEDRIISGGNFHGEPVAFAMDFLKIALAELANISERRTARLIDNKLSGHLPTCLTKDGGLNSGLMAAQYVAAALVSENKTLAHPASVDSIPTCANKEDHVSMGAIGARHCRSVADNVAIVLGIELLCAAQALDLIRPKKSSPALEAVYSAIRWQIPAIEKDRVLHYDLMAMKKLVKSGELINRVEKLWETSVF
ncbi:MAG: histidine ammonia-lyase [Patescibacteria group bacterium]